jgi:hypothetical protein
LKNNVAFESGFLAQMAAVILFYCFNEKPFDCAQGDKAIKKIVANSWNSF